MSYRWLGIASFGVPEKLGCAGLPLNSRQKELCKRKPYLLPSIREGARLGIQECRSQFRHERWNCLVATATSAPLATSPLFGYELSSGESPRPPGDGGTYKATTFLPVLAPFGVHEIFKQNFWCRETGATWARPQRAGVALERGV